MKKEFFFYCIILTISLFAFQKVEADLSVDTKSARYMTCLLDPGTCDRERSAICKNMRAHQLCHKVYSSCFDNSGKRIRYCNITLSASFLITTNYPIRFIDPETNQPFQGKNLAVGKSLKIEIGKPEGEWFFAGGHFDSPPITWVEDAKASYERLELISPLYQYIYVYNKGSIFTVLKPKVGVAADDPIKKNLIQIKVSDHFELSQRGGDNYLIAKKPGIAKVEIIIPDVFAYATIDNLWFGHGSIPGTKKDFNFDITTNSFPLVDAGPDKEVFEGQQITLEGSGSDPDGDPITFHWSCSGGTLSNPNIPQPIYTAPMVNQNTTYSCILKVTDNKGAMASDNMNILVKKSNRPPQAEISCDPSACNSTDCIAYSGCLFSLINKATDPDGSDDIVRSEWDILNWGTAPDLTCPGICNFTPQTSVLPTGNYQIKLLVKDRQGASDSKTITFYLRREVLADFMCSVDNNNWQDCGNIKPIEGQGVYFKDDPSLPKHSLPSEGATSITKRIWIVNGNIISSDNNPNPSATLNQSSNTVELRVTDDLGRTGSVSYSISTRKPPIWIPTPP